MKKHIFMTYLTNLSLSQAPFTCNQSEMAFRVLQSNY